MAEVRNGKFVAIIISIVLSAAFTLIGSWLIHLENEASRLEQMKADKSEARDRWTNLQMEEYKRYIESQLEQLRKDCSKE